MDITQLQYFKMISETSSLKKLLITTHFPASHQQYAQKVWRITKCVSI